MSSLVQWQVTTAAGLRIKEEKLQMDSNLADRQKLLIEQLRKENEMLGTDLDRSKDDNLTLSQSLTSTKEEVAVLAKQVKTASTQMRRVKEEKDELNKVEEERKHELGRLSDCFGQLLLTQESKEKDLMKKVKEMEEGLNQRKNKTEEDDEAALGDLRVLLEKLFILDDEKETIEKMGENREMEETLLTDEVDVAKQENSIIIVETGDMVEDRQGKDKHIRELIERLAVEEGKRSDELKCLTEVSIDEEKKIDKAVTKSLAIESDIVEIETKKSRFEDKRKEMETEKKYLDKQVL